MNCIKICAGKCFVLCMLVLGMKGTAYGNCPSAFFNDTSFVYMADPTIYYSNGKYYLYGTYDIDNSKGIRVYVSDNFKTFSQKNSFLAMKKGDAYGTANFWAPQVWKFRNKLYMFYVANEHIAVAEASDPKGPFTGKNVPLIEDKKTIDPFVFKDDDGRLYLFHVEFSGGNKIYVTRLKEDLSGIYPASDTLCIAAQAGWERKMDNVAEGPTVLKHKGWYYLIYSANHFKSNYYAVGYAVSRSINGPWHKYDGNPVLSMNGTGIAGTGHGDIFFDGKGRMFYVFHTHHSDTVTGPRKTAVAAAYFEPGKNNGPDLLKIDQKKMRYIELQP